MTDLFKFVVDGDKVTMFKVEDEGDEPVRLRSNQTLSFDPATNDVTLKTTFADHIALGLFHQTPDTSDDPSLYLGAGLSFTRLTAPRCDRARATMMTTSRRACRTTGTSTAVPTT
jgi:hypothetical protein